MRTEIWELVSSIVDERYDYEENIYKKEIDDIQKSIEDLAEQIELDFYEEEENND